MDLPLTLRAQYWNGSAWVMNSDDSCTAITAPTSVSGLTFYSAAAGAPGNHLSATETTATVNGTGKLASGDAGLRFSKPGSGNSGYVDISIPLALRPWLQFPWGISAVNPTGLNPTGRATFGIYSSRLIYSRENY
jgi:MSHA biogenesis protein MshQ